MSITAVNNGNRTDWSPNQFVIIRIINDRPICFITSMITDRTGRHEVLFFNDSL